MCALIILNDGLLASASIGDDNSLFEPIHGSYPQAKGKDIAKTAKDPMYPIANP